MVGGIEMGEMASVRVGATGAYKDGVDRRVGVKVEGKGVTERYGGLGMRGRKIVRRCRRVQLRRWCGQWRVGMRTVCFVGAWIGGDVCEV